MLLIALFVFIPGVYVLANLSNRGRLVRLFACLFYVVVAEFAAFMVLCTLNWAWRA